ncbi:MAG: DmsE family decaheme c-type cytochrome [Elusimicrobia bacterium]|nr:DmsE family decaheme c-type cytochrome [Elusimicrobiota bacterium]
MKMRNRLMSFIVAAACVSGLVSAAAAQEKATEVGASACAGCHAEQAESFKKSPHAKRMPAVKKIEFEKSCESCHGAGSLHVAAGGDRSNAGFATIKKPEAMPAQEANAGCLSCHKSQRHLMLWGTSIHKEAGLACVKCHSVHKGVGKGNLVQESSELCFSCHKKERGEMQLASHHPVIEGRMTCTGCHNVHGGVEGNMKAESVEDTCLKCHAGKAGPFAREHPPVIENCLICHKPHGSVNISMLKQAQPFLCLRCHKWPHVERSNGASAFDTFKFAERGRCTDCHREVHGSDRNAAFKK